MQRLAIVGLVIAAVLSGQKSQKLVTVNVSAVDSSGARPGDLTEQDFQIFEDGKPQKIASFVKTDGKSHPAEKLGPHEFSNAGSVAIPHATLILFDLLNDRAANKGYAWAEIIRTLATLEYGDNVYMYLLGLDGGAYPVHPFPDAETAKQSDDGAWIKDAKALIDAAMTKSLRVRPIEMQDTNTRVVTTMNALGSISARLAAIPGRKNLVWITRGIPISIGPQRSYTGDFIDYSGAIQTLANALEKSQIALYPVDIAPIGMDPTSDASNGGVAATNALPTTTGMGSAETLQQFADITGGVAFLNNNVHDAIRLATADAHMSYLISYYPAKPSSDGKYHKIKVTTSRKGLKIHSRAGYYAWAAAPLSRNDQEAALDGAINSQFDASTIGIHAIVSQSKKFYSSVHLDISIDRATLSDPESGHLLVTLADMHTDGKRGVSPTAPLDYTAGSGPIPFPQERTLDGSIDRIRVIVMDGKSNTVGSLTIPLVKEDLSPAGK